MPSFVACALFAFNLLTCLVHADEALWYSSPGYDVGEFSSFPTQHYISSSFLSVPRFNVLATDPDCTSDGMLIFIAPRGKVPKQPAPQIVDAHGHLVWTDPQFPNAYNFRVQKYEGKDILTFWVGDDQVRGHGSGEYVMMDNRYQEIGRFNAGHGLSGDLHEFLITDHGTALITIYQVVEHDLSSVGRPEQPSFIWDSLFQEIDMGTHEVLFEWRASDWFDMTDSYYTVRDYGTEDNAWDFFHINSVAKDPVGNYLISARYTHSAIYIDGKTGEPLWHLGGKRNSFADLSDGAATTFAGQHDARWHDDYTTITLFDNGADYDTQTSDYSRAVRVRIDTEKMEAKLLSEFVNPSQILSASQGSAQELPNGNMFVGYGFNGAWTEFDPFGKVLCDVEFEAASAFNTGDIQSYRTLKFAWSAFPTTLPDLAFEYDEEAMNGTAYMSWNGATEIDSWLVMHSYYPDKLFTEAFRVKRDGFESSTSFTATRYRRYMKAVPVDVHGAPLGESRVHDIYDEFQIDWLDFIDTPVTLALVILSAISTAFVIRWFIGRKKQSPLLPLTWHDGYARVPSTESSGG